MAGSSKNALALKAMALSIVFVVSLTLMYNIVTDRPGGFRLYENLSSVGPVDTEDISIPGGPIGHVDARIIRPDGSAGALPIVMYFHGGGWMMGNRYTYDRLVRDLATKTNSAVVFVEYSHSPAVKYPVANEEAYRAMEYMAENGRRFNLDPSRLAVAGDSAGGNMAAVVAIMAKQRGGPKVACQVLFYPVTDANFNTSSYQRYATGYSLDRDTMEMFWDNYLPDPEARRQSTASPLQAPRDQLKGLPPALVITSEYDVLRDEGEAYADKLRDAGVPAKEALFLGTTHGFINSDEPAESRAAQEAMDLASQTLQKALAK